MSMGSGTFILGMTAGMVLGTSIGMMVVQNQHPIRHAANQTAKRVGEAVDHLTDSMDLS